MEEGLHRSQSARYAAAHGRLACPGCVRDLGVVAFLEHAGGNGCPLVGAESLQPVAQILVELSRFYPGEGIRGLERDREAEPLSCLRLGGAAALPVAKEIAAAHGEPGPDRAVLARPDAAAVNDQPGEHLLCGVERNILTGTVLLEIANEAGGVAVVQRANSVRITSKRSEQLGVGRILAAHHLQTNTPPTL